MATNKREARLQELALTRFAVQQERRLRQVIGKAMTKAAKNLNDPLMLESLEIEHRADIEKALNNLWKKSSSLMYGLLYEQNQRKKFGAQFLPTITANAVAMQYIRNFGTQKITQVTRTTMDDIKRVINAGITEGLSEKLIGQAILDIAPTKSASRAQTIARTEAHASANYAAQETAASTGIEMRRQWVTAIDDRTRDDHAQVDGQIVGMNEPFIVGGEELMYPGDPSGSAEQVVNCRCAVVFIV